MRSTAPATRTGVPGPFPSFSVQNCKYFATPNKSFVKLKSGGDFELVTDQEIYRIARKCFPRVAPNAFSNLRANAGPSCAPEYSGAFPCNGSSIPGPRPGRPFLRNPTPGSENSLTQNLPRETKQNTKPRAFFYRALARAQVRPKKFELGEKKAREFRPIQPRLTPKSSQFIPQKNFAVKLEQSGAKRKIKTREQERSRKSIQQSKRHLKKASKLKRKAIFPASDNRKSPIKGL